MCLAAIEAQRHSPVRIIIEVKVAKKETLSSAKSVPYFQEVFIFKPRNGELLPFLFLFPSLNENLKLPDSSHALFDEAPFWIYPTRVEPGRDFLKFELFFF